MIDNVTYISGESEEMQAAFVAAKSSFETFLEAWKNRVGSNFGVKVAFPARGDSEFEFPWMEVLSVDSDTIIAIANTSPMSGGEFIANKKYELDFDDIVDWTFMVDGRAEGNFSTRVLIKQMSKAERDEIEYALGWSEISALN